MPRTRRTRTALLVLTLALVGSVSAQCRFEAPRELDLDLEGVRAVRLVTQAGDLSVTGAAHAAALTARGHACASNRALLDDVRLAASRDGNVLVLRTETPRAGFFFGYAHLDLVVVVPDTLPVEIDDGSGAVVVANVASLRLTDGSGDVRVDDVAGDLVLEDGSGDVAVTGVGGGVRIGADTSGAIHIEGVRGDVRIEADGSGDVDVRRVGGDLVFLRDGSGSVRYADVAGTVELP